jgi:hypothetical protein
MTTGNQVTPTSTALQARLMIYQPSQRPRERAGQWIDTCFGRCRVTGRLGQRHADIVESMLYVAERRREISDGGIELLIDPAKLRRMLSDHQYSHDRIKKLLTDLRAATVEIVTPEMESTGDSIIGGLIDHVRPSPMTRRDPLQLLQIRTMMAAQHTVIAAKMQADSDRKALEQASQEQLYRGLQEPVNRSRSKEY